MSATAKKPTVIAGNRDSRDIVERIQSRKSEELVVAFAGAVGCNLSEVIRSVKTHFEEYGYLAKVVKVSDLIREHFSENPAELPAKYLSCDLANLTGLDRYTALQDLGDELRSTYGTKALAALSMLTISTSREMEIEARGDDKPPRVVYLVDQLKNPS